MLVVFAGQHVCKHAAVREMAHPATSQMKGEKGDDSDSGGDAKHFYPAGHLMGGGAQFSQLLRGRDRDVSPCSSRP